MKISDFTGKHPIQLASAAVDALGRIADSLETLVGATIGTPSVACHLCEELGRLRCPSHGVPVPR